MSNKSAVINFGFTEHKEVDLNGKKKFTATYKFCKTKILETIGTTTGFVRHLRRLHKTSMLPTTASQLFGLVLSWLLRKIVGPGAENCSLKNKIFGSVFFFQI